MKKQSIQKNYHLKLLKSYHKNYWSLINKSKYTNIHWKEN